MSIGAGDPIILAAGLTKRFGERVAVDGIDLEVRRGETFGFLGPNGAGKTTTMRMIGAVSRPSAGLLRVLGLDPAVDGPRIRARLGVVPQRDGLDIDLRVAENLVIYARYFGLSRRESRRRAAELLDFVQLADRADEDVEHLSSGQRRRLVIARALVNDPDVVLLDEPTTGLDPQARHLLWDRLYRLKQRGATLILTTHYMHEAEQLCDRLVVMDEGRIKAIGSPRDLIGRHCTREVVELRLREGEGDDFVEGLNGAVESVERFSDRIFIYTADGDEVTRQLRSVSLHPESILVRTSTLEDVFLRLTGRSLTD